MISIFAIKNVSIENVSTQNQIKRIFVLFRKNNSDMNISIYLKTCAFIYTHI